MFSIGTGGGILVTASLRLFVSLRLVAEVEGFSGAGAGADFGTKSHSSDELEEEKDTPVSFVF